MLKFNLKDKYKFHEQLAKRFTIEYCKNNNILDLFNENIEHNYHDINTAFLWTRSEQGRTFWFKHFLDSAIEINKKTTQYKKYGLNVFYCEVKYDDVGSEYYAPFLEYKESEMEDVFPERHFVEE